MKGPLAAHALHPRVADGIRRHRRVDTLTDAHPQYRSLKRLFPRQERRFAGIVLDVLFDFLLCRHWSMFSNWERAEFTAGVYEVLQTKQVALPVPLAERASTWVAADWLRVYESLDGVAAVLDRVSHRLASNTGRRVDLAALLAQVWIDEARLELGFMAVFGDVKSALDGSKSGVIRCVD